MTNVRQNVIMKPQVDTMLTVFFVIASETQTIYNLLSYLLANASLNFVT